MASLPPANVPGSQFLEGLGGFGGFGADPVSLAIMGLKSGLALSQGDFIGAIPGLGGPIKMMMSIFGGGPGKTTASKKVGQQALDSFEPQAQIYEAFGIPMGSIEDPTAPRGKIWLNRGDLRRGNNIDKLVNDTIWEAVKKSLTPIFGADKTAMIFNELSSVSPLILLNNAEGVTQYLKERGESLGFDLKPVPTVYPEKKEIAGQPVTQEEWDMLKNHLLEIQRNPLSQAHPGTEPYETFFSELSSKLPENLRGLAESIANVGELESLTRTTPGRTTYTLWGGAIGTAPPSPVVT
ncbi:MAG: hypothetical protein QMD05_09640, partial [Candidatus Brocadiaceae bacterium]|nr:hypothetical protein [Candidatus Brocadiaceae bacterium]